MYTEKRYEMKELFLKSQSTKIATNLYIGGHDECIIIAPGWFMTKDSKAFSTLAEMLSDSFDVITLDFRGHGKSSGFFTFTQKESSDLDMVIKYAKEHYSKIDLLGFSLGAALVLIAGAKKEHNISKIIAVSPPESFDKIENHFWKKEAWYATLKKFELKRWISIRPSLVGLFSKNKIPPVSIIEQIKAPTLFIAGEKDPTVYCWHTKELYKKANTKKHLEIIKNGHHAEDLFLQDKTYFIKLCKNWLKDTEDCVITK